ncbi:hypothetical protein [Synechococcus sp. RSCCF101]|uniref:hypothetical protein n=1 Tax=Synechococcus sp. RSCCF101 TaxID=2511069 RepID=UPI001CDA0E3F|nr:hypothetical protein [Synechococcus sp. RSCCF101]
MDAARILCHRNRTIEALMPAVRRAVHGPEADRWPVLPGERLITRQAVMAAASHRDAGSGEEGGLVLASNRELLVRSVRRERCDLALLLSEPDLVPVAGAVEVLRLEADVADLRLSLRLLPPWTATPGRRSTSCRATCGGRPAAKRTRTGPAASGARLSACAMPSPPWDRRRCSRCTGPREAASARCSWPPISSGPATAPSGGSCSTWR